MTPPATTPTGKMGIRQRLLLVVLVAILPLFALLLTGAVADRRIAVESARTRTTDRARLGAEWQNDGLQYAKAVLNVLRWTSPAIIADAGQCHGMLQQVARRYPQFATIGVVDSGGTVRCLSLDTGPVPFHDLEVFRSAMEADDAALIRGKYKIGPLTGKPVIVLAEPLPARPDGSRPGIAYVTLDLNWAANRAREFASSDAESLTLVDTREATILARFPDGQHLAGHRLEEGPLLSAMRDHPGGGSLEAAGLEAATQVFGFAPLEGGMGLMVAVGLSRETVLAAANQRLLLGIACAILAAIVAAGMAWLFADRTQVRAIGLLLDTARRLGGGDLAARAHLGPWQAPEFLALGETLGTMAAAIEATQATLTQSERQLRLLADHSTDMIIRVREGGVRLFVSPACRKLVGWETSEMLRFSSHDTIHPDDVGFVADPRLFGTTPFVFTYRMRHKNGHYLWVEGAARGLPTEPGSPRECVLVVRDVGERVEAERRLKESEARYRLLEEQGTDMIFQLDQDLVRRYVSPACNEILGFTAQELTGTKPVGMVHPDDAERVAQVFRSVLSGVVARTSVVNRIRHHHGHWVWVEAQLKTMTNPDTGLPVGIIGSLRDISIRKSAEAKLEEANLQLEALARVDGLTGLANRRAFDEALALQQRRAVGGQLPLGLVMIDVDQFKLFNDRYGHLAGDDCLRQVGRAIQSVIYRPGDLAARYGGEEFVVLLPDTGLAGTKNVAERIRQAVLALDISHDGNPNGRVSISAGVSVLSAPGDCQALVLQADRALYAAKAEGRNRVSSEARACEGLAEVKDRAA